MKTDRESESALARVPTGMATRMLEITDVTLHSWRKRGKIKATRSPAGRYFFDVADYLRRNGQATQV